MIDRFMVAVGGGVVGLADGVVIEGVCAWAIGVRVPVVVTAGRLIIPVVEEASCGCALHPAISRITKTHIT
jgi:hypothetical protein